jgi:hypothetical protein
MTYKGIVKDNVIVLPEGVELPEGTEVEILVSPEEDTAQDFALLQLNSPTVKAMWDNPTDAIYDDEDWRRED